MKQCFVCALLVIFGVPSSLTADLPASEFQHRREQLMRKLPQGIVLLHARSDLFSQREMYLHSFQQDPNFYYFTGLENLLGAILVMDGKTGESWLFVPNKLSGPAGELKRPFIRSEGGVQLPGGIQHIEDWERFGSYISARLLEKPTPVLYIDDSGSWFFSQLAESNPVDLAPVENPLLLWKRALKARWPDADIRSASDVIHSMRLVKSENEIDILRQVGRISARATIAAIRSLRPGLSQREVEAEVVQTCIKAGGEGPSFWPWVLAGPEAVYPSALEAAADYHRTNRRMRSGELVHIDLGCEYEHYGGDVGRTAPVSGHFDPGQREVWELLVAGYKAGVAAIRDGVTREEVIAASLNEIKRESHNVRTLLGKRAASELLGPAGSEKWLLHGAGLECCERPLGPNQLRAGTIVVLEPDFAVDGQAFYLEDMILVTAQGHEVLTSGLPYSADEIERMVGTEENR